MKRKAPMKSKVAVSKKAPPQMMAQQAQAIAPVIQMSRSRMPPPMMQVDPINYGPFNDDDPIEVKPMVPPAESSGTSAPEFKISLKFGQDQLKVSPNPQEIPCVASVEAREVSEEEAENTRPGLDIVCVIDISGSMNGPKIHLVRKTLNFLVSKLTSNDRLSIVVFSSHAERRSRLIRCTDTGKDQLTSVIQGLETTNTTNIQAGLDVGLTVLKDRRTVNTVTTVLLLSDGQDDRGVDIKDRVQQSYTKYDSQIQGSYTVSTFGYGTDHDADTMNLIAEVKEGEFHFVETEESIADSFGDCLGGLVSIVADEIYITLSEQESIVPCHITKVYSESNGNYFKMPQLFSGDHKETVFMLTIPGYTGVIEQDITITPVSAQCAYRLVKTGEVLNASASLSFNVTEADVAITIDEDVYVHLGRVMTSEILKQASAQANADNLAEARATCDNGISYLTSLPVASHATIVVLIQDFHDAKARFADSQTWHYGGKAAVSSMQKGHYAQKATVSSEIYTTSVQRTYKQAAKKAISHPN